MVGWLFDFLFCFAVLLYVCGFGSLLHAFYLIFSVPLVGDAWFRHIVENVQYVMPLQIFLRYPHEHSKESRKFNRTMW